ncbi:PDDEXK-like family protein [Nautilia lithotrophica]
MKDIKKICNFFKEYQKEKNKQFERVCKFLKKFRRQKEEMRLRGFNDFNYIELLKGFDDENTHSKIIAEFLNPDGNHYQGKIFLENFFKILDIPFNIDRWNVTTERFVGNCIDKGQGRIDIYLTNGKKHIILENKIEAGDQEAQIFKYVECLYKENKDELNPDDILVLYLTKDKHLPSKYSLDYYKIKNGYLDKNGEKKAKIKCISYDEILIWMYKNLQAVENISNLREAITQYIKVVKKVLNKEDGIMNLKDYLLKEKNKDVLITLVENKEEFDNYVKNDEECQKIIEEEKLDEVLEEIFKLIRVDIIESIKNYITNNYEYLEGHIPFGDFNKMAYILFKKENLKYIYMLTTYQNYYKLYLCKYIKNECDNLPCIFELCKSKSCYTCIDDSQNRCFEKNWINSFNDDNYKNLYIEYLKNKEKCLEKIINEITNKIDILENKN